MIDMGKLGDYGWGGFLNLPTEGTKPLQPGGQEPAGTPATQNNQATGGTMETMQYPEQWGQASDVWSQLASGQYTNPGMDWLTNMMQSGGSPVDVSGWGAAQQPLMMQQFSDMTKEMAEQAGMGGTRYGSGLQGNIARYGGQLQNQFQSNLMDRWLQSQEAAKGRAYGAGQGLSQLGLQGQVAGAEGLGGLGQQYANLPMQLAQSMTGVGGYMTGQQIDPWTQMMAGMVGNPYMTQQTYQQSPLQSILGILGGTPWGDIFGGGGTPSPSMQGVGGILGGLQG